MRMQCYFDNPQGKGEYSSPPFGRTHCNNYLMSLIGIQKHDNLKKFKNSKILGMCSQHKLLFFFNCYLAVPQTTLGHSEGDSLTNPMSITLFVHILPKGHQEPCNEVGSLSPADSLAGFEPGTFQFLLQCLNPLGHSPQIDYINCQIDYINCQENQKHLLCNSRSFSNTLTSTDHCIVVTKMNIQMHCLYKKENKRRDKPFNSQLLTMNENIRNQYKTELKLKIEQQIEWNDIENSITSTAKVTIGYLNRVHNSNNIYCDEIAIPSQQQKHLRQKISNCKEVEKINNTKTERNKILHQIQHKVKKHKKQLLKNKLSDINNAKGGPFFRRGMRSHVHTPTHAQKCLDV